MRRLGAFTALCILMGSVQVASAQSLIPLKKECGFWETEAFWWPYDGYYSTGYTNHGILTMVDKVHRYTKAGWYDEDWNFYIRAVDDVSCPDGETRFGRDCKTERERFVDIFWDAGSETWKKRRTWEMIFYGVHKSKYLAQARKTFKVTLNQLKKNVGNKLVKSGIIEKSVDVDVKYPLNWSEAKAFGKLMWLAAMRQPNRWKVMTKKGQKQWRPVQVEGEVQISTRDPDDEAANKSNKAMMDASHLSNCHKAGNGLCGQLALFYGTASGDTNHDDGKPEMHPVRAIVTATNLKPKKTTKPITYTVRTFSDYGKAGDGGSGDIAGRICEWWAINDANNGKYQPYVQITPKTFVFPERAIGKGVANKKFCHVKRVVKNNVIALKTGTQEKPNGLRSFPNNSTDTNCDFFVADAFYRKGKGTQFGGYGTAEVTVGYQPKGVIKGTVQSGTPVSMGLIRKGQWLNKKKKIRAKQTAHYYRINASAKLRAKIGSGKKAKLKATSAQEIRWSAKGNAKTSKIQWTAKTTKGFTPKPYTLYKASGPKVDGYWGSWGNWGKCPKGSYAYAFRQKVEKKKGSGDDTALNSIQLKCRTAQGKYTGVIKSRQGWWGSWSSWRSCPKGHFLTSYKMRVEKKQKSKDDTAANDVRFRCSNGQQLIANKRGPWGTWRPGQTCGKKGYINSFVTRVETKQKSKDDTALNGLSVGCASKVVGKKTVAIQLTTLYVPVAPLKSLPLNKFQLSYKFKHADAGWVDSDTQHIRIRFPAVSATPNEYSMVRNPRTNEYLIPLRYRVKMNAYSSLVGSPTYEWYVQDESRKYKRVASGTKATITLDSWNTNKSALKLVGKDGYESNWARIGTNVPPVFFTRDVKKASNGKASSLTSALGKSLSNAICIESKTVTFWSKTEVVGTLNLPTNFYEAPPLTDIKYEWKAVEKMKGSAPWETVPNAQYTTDGAKLVLTALNPTVKDWGKLYFFRAYITATEKYGRQRGAWIYFKNYDDSGATKSAARCISTVQLSKIPTWNWGKIDPVWTAYRGARDASNPLRNPGLLDQLRLFQVGGAEKGQFAKATPFMLGPKLIGPRGNKAIGELKRMKNLQKKGMRGKKKGLLPVMKPKVANAKLMPARALKKGARGRMRMRKAAGVAGRKFVRVGANRAPQTVKVSKSGKVNVVAVNKALGTGRLRISARRAKRKSGKGYRSFRDFRRVQEMLPVLRK
jgi:hypothetical protein